MKRDYFIIIEGGKFLIETISIKKANTLRKYLGDKYYYSSERHKVWLRYRKTLGSELKRITISSR